MSFLRPTPVGYLYHKHFKLMDTSTLNQKIANLGAKTDKDSITPDGLASLLSEISSLLETLNSESTTAAGDNSTMAQEALSKVNAVRAYSASSVAQAVIDGKFTTLENFLNNLSEASEDGQSFAEQMKAGKYPDGLAETLDSLVTTAGELTTKLSEVRELSAKGVEQSVASGSYTNLENFLNNLRVAAESGQTHVEQMKQGVFPTALSDRLSAMEASIAEIESAEPATTASVSSLTARIEKNESTIDSLINDSETNLSAHREYDKTISRFNEHFDGLDSQVYSLNNSVTSQQKTLDTQQETVDSLTGDVEKHTSDLSKMNVSISYLDGKVEGYNDERCTSEANIIHKYDTEIENLKGADKTIYATAQKAYDFSTEIITVNTETIKSKATSDVYTFYGVMNDLLEGQASATKKFSAYDSAIAEMSAKSGLYPLSVEVVNGGLCVYSSELSTLVNNYTPYLFRLTRKKNRAIDQTTKKKVRMPPRKGWHCFGGPYAVMVSIYKGVGKVLFSQADHFSWHTDVRSKGYSIDPKLLLCFTPLPDEDQTQAHYTLGRFGFGSSTVRLDEPRMLRMPFAIGFGPKVEHAKVTPDMLVTPLVPFSLVHSVSLNTEHGNPGWKLSK